jgi:hypothetical protein
LPKNNVVGAQSQELFLHIANRDAGLDMLKMSIKEIINPQQAVGHRATLPNLLLEYEIGRFALFIPE